jgi:hypothetical protein
MHADTEGVPTDMLTSPWLRRTALFSDFLPSENFILVNGQQVKICLNTYKLFYLISTEDVLVRKNEARAVSPGKWKYDVAARRKDGMKWTRNGHVTLEAQNAAAAAEAEAKEREIVPEPPPIELPAIAPPVSETPRSPDATPVPVPAVVEPATSGEAKDESPTLKPEVSEAMDVESTSAPPTEIPPEAPQPASDVEMHDA